MPRARNIKPSFFKNEVLGLLSFEARLTFIGLWTLADKEGRLEDRPMRIKIELFPFDNRVNVEASLQQLHDGKLIFRYENTGCRYLFIPNFKKHQRPHSRELESEIPPYCNQQLTQKKFLPKSGQALPKSGQALPKSGQPDLNAERGMLNTPTPPPVPAGETIVVPIIDTQFAEFWKLYPRKDGRAAAEKAYRTQATTKAKAETIMDALKLQLPGLLGRDPQYRPHARTWLQQRRWEDGPEASDPAAEVYEFEYQRPFDFARISPPPKPFIFPGISAPPKVDDDGPSIQEIYESYLREGAEEVI